MLKNIKKDLEALQGDPARDNDDITVNIIDLIDALVDYEISDGLACKLLHVESIDDIDGLDYDYADNSYNWSGMGSNDFDYKTFKTDNGDIVVSIKFHRFGDVRGNYTEDAFLLFDDANDFHEIVGEQMHDFYIVVEKSTSGLSEKLEFLCTSRINDEYIRCNVKGKFNTSDADILARDKSDVLAELVKHLEKMQ